VKRIATAAGMPVENSLDVLAVQRIVAGLIWFFI
jgi:hypothetical protein